MTWTFKNNSENNPDEAGFAHTRNSFRAMLLFVSLLMGQFLGCPDLAFDGDGTAIYTVSISSIQRDLHAEAVSFDENGKILISGWANVNSKSDLVTYRVNTNGSIDTTFASPNGYDVQGLGTRNESAVGISLLSDNSILIPYRSLNPSSQTTDNFINRENFGFLKYTTSGAVSKFAIPAHELSFQAFHATAMSVLPDDTVLIGGWVYRGLQSGVRNFDYFITKYQADLSHFDTTFGSGTGYILVDYATATGSSTPTADSMIAFVKGGNDSITFLGDSCYQNATPCYRIGRIKADGTIDTSFGTSGFINLDSALTTAQLTAVDLNAIAFDSSENIIVAGSASSNSAPGGHGPDFAVLRLDNNGVLDPTFGTNGATLVDFKTYRNATNETQDVVNTVSVDPNDYILLAGTSSETSGNNYFAAARVTPTGRLDNWNGRPLEEIYKFKTPGGTYHESGAGSATAMAVNETSIILTGEKQDWNSSYLAYGAVKLAINAYDECLDDNIKTDPGICGCGISDADADGDGEACDDACPVDPLKTDPGECGCGAPDDDTDGDGTVDCVDSCPADPEKDAPGDCGCGIPDDDNNENGVSDCLDPNGGDDCPLDSDKFVPGDCGCGVPDVDSDDDGLYDCEDLCPNDPEKEEPGECGCSVPDDDDNLNDIMDCVENGIASLVPKKPVLTLQGKSILINMTEHTGIKYRMSIKTTVGKKKGKPKIVNIGSPNARIKKPKKPGKVSVTYQFVLPGKTPKVSRMSSSASLKIAAKIAGK